MKRKSAYAQKRVEFNTHKPIHTYGKEKEDSEEGKGQEGEEAPLSPERTAERRFFLFTVLIVVSKRSRNRAKKHFDVG